MLCCFWMVIRWKCEIRKADKGNLGVENECRLLNFEQYFIAQEAAKGYFKNWVLPVILYQHLYHIFCALLASVQSLPACGEFFTFKVWFGGILSSDVYGKTERNGYLKSVDHTNWNKTNLFLERDHFMPLNQKALAVLSSKQEVGSIVAFSLLRKLIIPQ